VTEVLESTGGLALIVAMVVGAGFIAYWVFGPQAVGLPAIIGLFALWGLISLVSDAGLGAIGVVVVIGGVIAVLLIIGMAMRFGDRPPRWADDERPRGES
jgi:hypothetical protein